MSDIYSNSSANIVLGSLCNDLSLALNSKYPLTKGEKGDFQCVLFHRIVYGALYNMATHGAKSVDAMDVDLYIKENFGTYYTTFVDNNGLEFISTIKELANEQNYELYYNNVRKYSLIRAYDNKGFDITPFWNRDKSDSINEENLGKYTVDEICEWFEKKQVEIKKEFINNQVKEEYKAGTDFLNTIEEIKSGGVIGDSFQSPYLNRIFNGLYGFILRSGGSGDGKSLSYVGDMMTVGCKSYWDEDKQSFVENKSFVGACLMINTELDLRKELELMLIAWISNVDRGKIRRWDLTKDEEDRILESQKILEDSPIYLVDDPEFTIKSITNTVTDYVRLYDVKNVFFDYLNSNGFLDNELSKEMNISQRQDMILQTATDRIKQLQRSFGIGFESGTQLNAKVQERDSTPSEIWMAGGVSQIRKVDGACIMTIPTKKELEIYDKYEKKPRGFDKTIKPNRVTHIVKGRNSEFPKYLKIYHYLDTGTCRNKDLLVTDKSGYPIQIDPMIIEK